MARSKRTPERSQIARGPTTAFARRQRTGDDGGGQGDDDDKPDEKPAVPRTMTTQQADKKPEPAKPAEAKSAAQGDAPKPDELPAIEPPVPKGEPWPDATPAPMKPVDGWENAARITRPIGTRISAAATTAAMAPSDASGVTRRGGAPTSIAVMIAMPGRTPIQGCPGLKRQFS